MSVKSFISLDPGLYHETEIDKASVPLSFADDDSDGFSVLQSLSNWKRYGEHYVYFIIQTFIVSKQLQIS